MAHYNKGSYPPLIGGESQQIDQDRHENQVTRMVNMLPDAVSGIRRRGGFEFLQDLSFTSLPYMQHITVAEREYLLLIEPGSFGRLRIYDIEAGAMTYDVTHEYLKGSGISDLDFVTHQDELFILNRSKTVTKQAVVETGPDPARNGYFVVIGGSFDMDFNVGLKIGETSTMVTYKTPSSGASQAQPEHIAEKLVEAAQADDDIGTAAGFTWTRLGANVHVSGGTDFSVITDLPGVYIRVSNSSNVKDTAELAAKLPDTADGMIIRTGTKLASAYWQWKASTQQWNETCEWGSDVRFDNLPLRLVPENGTWTLGEIPQTGRMSGNPENNPDPSFAGRQITGIGSFQGRLVFLCGDSVSMSASNEIGHWYRVSVTSLSDSDTIDAQGTTTSGVNYRFAVPLDGDLILFSATQQSTITGRAVVTPKNISLAPSGMLPMIPTIKPVHTGRGLLLASPTAPGYCSIWEITGGQYRDSTYSQHDTTLHLPTYIPDNIYTLTAGQTGKYAAAVLGDCSLRVLSTVQHLGEVVQQSWHTWQYQADTRPLNIAQAQWHNEVLYVLLERDNQYRLVKWSDRYVGETNFNVQVHLDELRPVNYSSTQVVSPWSSFAELTNGVFLAHYRDEYTLKEEWRSYDYRDFVWEYTAGSYRANTDVFKDALSVQFGWRYPSEVKPTTPMVRVQNSRSNDDRPQLHRLLVRCADTGTVVLEVQDKARHMLSGAIVPALYTVDFNDEYVRARGGVMQFPVRTDMHTTEFALKTADVYDMRILGIEFGYRPNMRYARTPPVMQGE